MMGLDEYETIAEQLAKRGNPVARQLMRDDNPLATFEAWAIHARCSYISERIQGAEIDLGGEGGA